jgi:hypothetical protein
MDQTNTKMNVKSPITLEQVLTSYNILISFLSLFIFLVLLMYILNPTGFNKIFGYEIFITGPLLILFGILIKEIIVFKNNPQSSWLSSLPQSNQNWFFPVIILGVVLIGLAGFFSMLAIGGVFSEKPPENNTAMIINFFIIMLFFIIAGLIYKNSQKKDETVLQTLPRAIQDVFALRTKYTVLFALFAILIVILYFVNPWGIMTNYGGPVLFFSLFVGMIMVIMITVYQYYMSNPSKANMFSNEQGFMGYLLKGLYILAALGISGGLIYGALKMMGLFNQDASKPETWGHIIFNVLIFSAMLGIVYKLANAGGFLDKNPYYRLLLNTLLYIPCLLVSIFNYIGQMTGLINRAPGEGSAFTPPKPFEIKMLILSLVLLSSYFLWTFLGQPYLSNKYLKQGGKQLINQPIPTDVLTNVASYQTLSGSDKPDYQYALSFWFYLDSFPPSTNSSYMKVVPILSYGENPCIKYSSETNTLFITVKQDTEGKSVIDYVQTKEKDINPETINKWKESQDKITSAIERVKSMPFGNDIDAEGHRIIYKQQDVLLQKWNHIVLNYNGGTLDVFYNGKLVKSAIEVVPYMKLDTLTVGSENGVSGNIANLIYFKNPLDILSIHTLYNSLKNKNPPSIQENKETLVSLIS